MRIETLSKPETDACKCPTCGGEVQRRPYGEMHAGSFICDGGRVEIRAIPKEGFSDPIYLDALTQFFNGGLYRAWPNDKYLSKGGKRLHRDVWKGAFGEIPKGCHIHHRDGNAINNRLDNLECMDAAEHLRLTWKETQSGRAEHFSPLARDRAADWHKSAEGKLWHKRHAERSEFWTKNKRTECACVQCGVIFMGLDRAAATKQKYCSPACKRQAYRLAGKASGYSAAYRVRKASRTKI